MAARKGATPKQSRYFSKRADKRPLFVSDEIPLYYQLAMILREQILSGDRRIGDKLPTELEMENSYGVSRITVRQALRSLEDEGLIRRHAGRGTFVSGLPVFTGSLEMDGTINGLIAMGLATAPRLLELQEMELTPQEARTLQMEPERSVIRATRVRYYRDEPYCYIINHVPASIGRRISRTQWEKGSLLDFMEKKFEIKLGDAEERVSATLADATLARWLHVRVGAPLLRVEYNIRDEDGRPVETAIIHYRSDRYAFTLHLTRSAGRARRKGGWSLREPPETDAPPHAAAPRT